MSNRRKEEGKPLGTGKGHIKFRYSDRERYFDLEVEGVSNEAAVAEGLKSIATALSGQTSLAKRALPSAIEPEGKAEIDNEIEAEPATPVDRTELDDSEETGEMQAERPRRRAAPKAPKFLSDLKLVDAKVPLAEFMSKKGSPKEMMDKYTRSESVV